MLKWILKILKWFVCLFFASSILAVVAYRFIPVPFTPLMFLRSVEQVRAGKSITWHHDWVSLDKMSKHMPVAVMASEDQLFLKHHGFDWEQICKAWEDNKTHKRKRGGSGISQQTAKNVFLWPDRTLLRKGLETYFTILIELFWSKQRIMEVYLNSIEMGDGIYGVEAVAQHHFHKPASALTRSECALIAATLPNPLLRNSAHPDTRTLRIKRHIEGQMKFMPTFPAKGEDYDPNTSSGGIYHKKK